MAGTVQEARLGTPTARSRLKPGRMPHWNTIVAGRDHLGWQRRPKDRAGRWLLRTRRGGDYSIETIGTADDAQGPDGISILTYEQARARAVELSTSAENRPARRLTVRKAMADYIDHLGAVGKSARMTESATVAHILPALGNAEVESLTSAQLQRFLANLAAKPARVRTAKGKSPRLKLMPADDETRRRRQSSANRVFKILRAALNHAFDARRVPSHDAWGRRVKLFRGVEAARVRYLSIDESIRLINSAEEEFRPLVRAALETGCRYSELGRMQVSDFNPDAGTALVRKSKSAKQRHVVLTAEGTAFFAKVCAGRAGNALMFSRSDGEAWGASQQALFMRRASQRASISPEINFHALRHTWASHAVMNGIPLMVVAQNLGHADLRMVTTHYGHLAQSYVTDAIRAGAPRFKVREEETSVEPMRLAKKRRQ